VSQADPPATRLATSAVLIDPGWIDELDGSIGMASRLKTRDDECWLRWLLLALVARRRCLISNAADASALVRSGLMYV